MLHVSHGAKKSGLPQIGKGLIDQIDSSFRQLERTLHCVAVLCTMYIHIHE